MLSIDYDDLRNAFEFVSAGPPREHHAYISLVSGAIYWLSSSQDLEEDVPDNVEDSKFYLEVPHKNELQLGQKMALAFIKEALPDDYNTVANFFRKPGAYRRLKELLQAQGLLEQWFSFEANACNEALLEWCEDYKIVLTNTPAS